MQPTKDFILSGRNLSIASISDRFTGAINIVFILFSRVLKTSSKLVRSCPYLMASSAILFIAAPIPSAGPFPWPVSEKL